jgi:hypothetical protein
MFFHKELTKEKWQSLSIFEQMANIGAEIGRTENWKVKDKDLSMSAFYRGLELLDLTISDKKNNKKLKELCRLREMLVDYFIYDNIYASSGKEWSNYFFAFNYAAAINR